MQEELAKKLAKDAADKSGLQIVVVEDRIANAEDESGPFGFMPTLSIPTFIHSLRRGGKIVEVIEPAKSKRDRRKDLEDELVALFRRNPDSLCER